MFMDDSRTVVHPVGTSSTTHSWPLFTHLVRPIPLSQKLLTTSSTPEPFQDQSRSLLGSEKKRLYFPTSHYVAVTKDVILRDEETQTPYDPFGSP